MQRYNSITRRYSTTALAALFFVVSVPSSTEAYDATVAWTGGANTDAIVGYKIYVRQGVNYSGVVPTDAGLPTADSKGVYHFRLTGIPMGPTSWFSVNGYTAQGVEARQSNELTVDYATAARTVDSDGDGLVDAEEDKNLDRQVDPGESDPGRADSDNDGLSDSVEIEVTGTDPLKVDSDGDGYSDGQENADGTDPNSAASNAGAPEPICGNDVLEYGEQCDDGAANSDARPDACRRDCSMPTVCGDATGDRILSVTDALQILRGSVASSVCPLGNCDTDGNGVVAPTDGLRVIRTAVGQNVGMNCDLRVTLVLQDSVTAGRTEAVVDYQATGSTFTGEAGEVHCESLLGDAAEVEFYNDVASGELVMSIVANQAIEGGVDVADCRFAARRHKPDKEDFTVEVVDHPAAGSGETAPQVWIYF